MVWFAWVHNVLIPLHFLTFTQSLLGYVFGGGQPLQRKILGLGLGLGLAALCDGGPEPVFFLQHCPPLPHGAALSTPAFSTLPFLTLLLCLLPQIPSTRLDLCRSCVNQERLSASARPWTNGRPRTVRNKRKNKWCDRKD